MKTPKEYVEYLKNKYYKWLSSNGFQIYNVYDLCIMNVEDTIEALRITSDCGEYFELTPEFDYYNQVLAILKTK